MKPWLMLNPEWAHRIAPMVLPVYSLCAGQKEIPQWRGLSWRGLTFKNPLGLAGGADKNADQLKSWWNLGAGFIEIGTVTPEPQGPNSGKIIDRDLKNHALWNKMGFPSKGSEKVRRNLDSSRPYRTPVFVNIGKNRNTPNEEALSDYLKLIEIMNGAADVFVINISSPNTKGLRELQNVAHLEKLISGVKKLAGNTPILLKLSPDLSEIELKDSMQTAILNGIDGFELTNTTLQRPNGIDFPSEGGLSGMPLAELSKKALVWAQNIISEAQRHKHGASDLLLVSAGGILNETQVQERLDLGANLVQIYSALIFEGPGFFRKVARKHAQ